MTITYKVKNGIYVNMTNRCPCACTFCLRQNGEGVYGSDSLWLEREPTVEDIVAYMEANGESHTKEAVVNALEAIVEPVSLYDPVYGDGASAGDSLYVMDQIRDTDGGEEVWLESIALKEALKQLSPREKTILGMRFYRGKTQMEIAAEIGISQAQVSRLEKGALERIRKQI